MDKKLAKEILPLVNDPDHYALLNKYVAGRIETLRGYLEKTPDHAKITAMQGQIAELRTFQTLREQAIEMARNK